MQIFVGIEQIITAVIVVEVVLVEVVVGEQKNNDCPDDKSHCR